MDQRVVALFEMLADEVVGVVKVVGRSISNRPALQRDHRAVLYRTAISAVLAQPVRGTSLVPSQQVAGVDGGGGTDAMFLREP